VLKTESLVHIALDKGARIYGSISGGKDSQAMVKTLMDNKYPVSGLIHADLGRIEWPQSRQMCRWLSDEFKIPLHIVTRSDGLDLLAYWRQRMEALKGTDKPFWSSSVNRYCTSGMKVQPINRLLTRLENFVISAEGVRAAESNARSIKHPLSVRISKSSTYYHQMSVEEAIRNYTPEKRLVLNWYPIFKFGVEQVWSTFGMSGKKLMVARDIYQLTGKVADWWPFHPAYAFGNDRVSCMFCILGSLNDLKNAAKHHPELLKELIAMEQEGGATFKYNWSLQSLTEGAEVNKNQLRLF
jgi:3'-phosphoadenosine 5'-phosphosulfate sulfotransferase (PAPS reductase)/FAD synthetase